MRDPGRCANVAQQVGELWSGHVPDWRLGQMISNFESYLGTDIFYISDEDFIQKLNNYMNGYRNKDRELSR